MNRILLSLLSIAFPFIVLAQNPGLYNETEGLSGSALKTELHNIIKNHTVVSYYDTKYVLADSDQDPSNPNNIIEVYTGWSHDATDYGTGGDHLNREHVWAKSHGDFNEVYPMYSDIHNLKPADASVNMSRSNKDFDNGGTQHQEATGCYYTSDTWEPRDEVKGDVARIIFYMATRYEGDDGEIDLKVVDYVDTYPLPEFGKLSTLIEWNNQDPPDDFERNRNDVIETHQHNRNPFIDNPEWINYIWNNEIPSNVLFPSFSILPEFPQEEDAVVVSTKISGIGQEATVKLAWGTNYNVPNSNNMTLENGFWKTTIPQQPQGTKIYIKVITTDNGTTNSSVTYSYTVSAKALTIAEIQGDGGSSPFIGELVTTRGIVTAHFGNSYFLQDGTEPRSGIFVYDGDNSAKIGDQALISGEVVEYFDLTEIKSVTEYELEASGVELPSPIIIDCNETSEDWESMLVQVKAVECVISDWQSNDDLWVVSDATGEINIENNSTFSYQNPQIGQDYNVKGVLNYSWNSWRIKIQSEDDVEIANAISDINLDDLFAIFPNPATNYLSISLNNDISTSSKINIYDITGRSVYNVIVSKNSGENMQIPIKNWKQGVYIIQIQTENNTKTWRKKLIVK